MVRQRFLIPPPVGSNPAAPTNPRRILSAYFVDLRTLKAQCIKIHFRNSIFKFAYANLGIYRIASSRMNRDIRDEFLIYFHFSSLPRNHLKILRGFGARIFVIILKFLEDYVNNFLPF